MNRIKSAREACGFSQQKMSDLLGIPKRTIEAWDAGERKCPEWTERLIVDKLETMRNAPPLLSAIHKEIKWLFEKVLCNPKNDGKDMSKVEGDILCLCDEFFKVRGRRGAVVFSDEMPNDVESIRALVVDGMKKRPRED